MFGLSLVTVVVLITSMVILGNFLYVGGYTKQKMEHMQYFYNASKQLYIGKFEKVDALLDLRMCR